MADVAASGLPDPVLSVSVLPCASGHRLAAVSLAGELDRSNEEDARLTVERCLARGACCLVIDLGGLTFMDSSGINLLVRTYNTLAQRRGRLALVAPAGPIRRVLEMVRLSPRVPIYSSLQHAVSELAPHGTVPNGPRSPDSVGLGG